MGYHVRNNVGDIVVSWDGKKAKTSRNKGTPREFRTTKTAQKAADLLNTAAPPEELYFFVMDASVSPLFALALGLGVQSEDLDDAVHDLAQEVELDYLNTLHDEDDQEEHISAQERFASNINNGGLDSQIEFLLQHNNTEVVEQLIKDRQEKKQ